MAVLHDHRGDAKGRGTAQDGADIVGIRKLVQHQHYPTAPARFPKHLIEVERFEGPGL